MEKNFKNALPGPSGIPTIDISRKVENPWIIPRTTVPYHGSTDASLFSSSLPVLQYEKFSLNGSRYSGLSVVDDDFPPLSKFHQETERKKSLVKFESTATGSLLPGDEDELLAGIMDDFDLSGLPTQLEDLEDDLFDSGGGMELDFVHKDSLLVGVPNGIGNLTLTNGGGTIAGEHPYGEHPSRTLFVRNISSNVEDFELKSLFEQYGDIRNLYTACKHRGFVMISYYDIRAARTAMRALQNKPLRRRKLDIHFSIPKDNPSEKDINQGTLVVFNLDASVSNDDLRQIFGAYGEIKEIRETPHKRHHKFIEFYDVRAAEAALKALNRIDIAGKRIKLEPSRPGGARRNLLQQLSQELEQDETWTFRNQVGSPFNSPPGNWTHFGSPVEHSSLQGFNMSPRLETLSPVSSNRPQISGLASILPTHASIPVKIAPIGKESKDQGRSIPMAPYQRSRSFPDQNLIAIPGPVSSFGDSSSSVSGIGTLSGPEFLWGSPNTHSERSNTSGWPTSSMRLPVASGGQGKCLLYLNKHGTVLGSPRYHVGSAPSGVPLDRHFSYLPDSTESSFLSPAAFGALSGHNGSYVTNMGPLGSMGVDIAPFGNIIETGSPRSRMMSMPRNGLLFFRNGSYQGTGAINEGLIERVRAPRVEYGNQIENKKQYQLDLDKIVNGEDSRTTLMIKNIPNKYTSKMLLLAIDECHRGTYDFLYLPIDFKNKCNVGYAFINMVSPSHIISFYQAFNGKRWEKFNSEKVASLAYARIQGKEALVTHFQNSNLMNEDKRCRPILFQSEGQGTDDQELFPYNNLNICIRQPDGSYLGDSLESPTTKPEENH